MQDGSYFKNHPPRCMSRLCRSLPDQFLPDLKECAGYVAFGLLCPSGSSRLMLLGKRDGHAPDLCGPLAVRCDDCGKENPLLDPRKDGYDGELGQFSAEYDTLPATEYECPDCGGKTHELGILLEVQGEPGDLPEEHRSRPEDFFNSASVYGICAHCDARGWLFSQECA